jgi:hypothetical protein
MPKLQMKKLLQNDCEPCKFKCRNEDHVTTSGQREYNRSVASTVLPSFNKYLMRPKSLGENLDILVIK